MQIEAPKIRTALALWADDLGLELSQLDADMLIDRIRAVSAVTPAEVGGLVEKLRQCADDPMWADHAEVPKRWLSEAAAALEAQAAELATMKQDFETLAELQKAAFQRAERAEAALAEARKALVIANVNLDNMEFLSVEGFIDWQQEHRAARRALAGGQEDG